MNFRGIRFRLTLGYLLILAVGLGALSAGSWFAMRESLFHAIDRQLDDRLIGIEHFMREELGALSLAEIRHEFREYSVLGPGGDLFVVYNQQGEWLYRSAALEKLAPFAPAESGTRYENVSLHKLPHRFATHRAQVHGQNFTLSVAAPVAEFDAALQRFAVLLWLSSPLLLLIAAAGGYWLSARALRPVEAIRAAAQSISIGNLAERLVVPPTGDELQRLSETLNAMLARLHDSLARMSQFTADASHELRAPIALIRTTAELAVQQGRTNEQYAADMGTILAESERTSRLIQSLLLLARADAGQGGLEKERMDLTLSVREAIAQLSTAAQAKQIVIHLDAPDKPVALVGDTEALQRAVFALIENAIKYSPSAGTVSVQVSRHGSDALCSVTDHGIGVAADHQACIFHRFWRADAVRSRGQGGAGLGLSIAQWIVQGHQGQIEVASEPGQGSTFVVRIPTEYQE